MTDTRFKRIEKKKTQELISYDHSVWKDIKKELFSNKIALVSIIILLIIIIASILAPLSPYDPIRSMLLKNCRESLQSIFSGQMNTEETILPEHFTEDVFLLRLVFVR